MRCVHRNVCWFVYFLLYFISVAHVDILFSVAVSSGDSGHHHDGGEGSGGDSGDQMDADSRARELARRKEEAKRRRRKKKRTGSSLVSSCFQGKLDKKTTTLFDFY